MQPEVAAHAEQLLPVGAHEMRHGLAAHAVPMKPNAAVEGETHPVAAACELAVGRRYVQVILPSTVAFPTGVAFPEIR